MTAPVAFRWMNGSMVPLNRFFADRAAKQFEPGREYVLVPKEGRSIESHNHYFLKLHEAWLNLDEKYTDEIPSEDHLRAWALVKAGFAERHTIKCASHDDALRTAAIAASRDKIRIIEINDCLVTIWIPESQSMKEMGKERFQASKTAVLDIVSAMARTTREELEKNAGNHA